MTTLEQDLKEIWQFECRHDKGRYWRRIFENLSELSDTLKSLSYTCQEATDAVLKFKELYTVKH